MADTSAFDELGGFANSPTVTKGKKTEAVDPREVPAYVDETDAGQVREKSQTTKSSIVGFKSEGKSTNGAPAAVVPAPEETEDPVTDEESAHETPEEPASDGEQAEGKEDGAES